MWVVRIIYKSCSWFKVSCRCDRQELPLKIFLPGFLLGEVGLSFWKEPRKPPLRVRRVADTLGSFHCSASSFRAFCFLDTSRSMLCLHKQACWAIAGAHILGWREGAFLAHSYLSVHYQFLRSSKTLTYTFPVTHWTQAIKRLFSFLPSFPFSCQGLVM